jgi:metallo-beta-lactamase family protein
MDRGPAARRVTVPPASLAFLGAAATVTGSKFLLDLAGRRVLVDCGLYQGLKELRLRNWQPLPVAAASIEHVVLTHAHIDHSGYVPRLINDGFTGPIHATPATADLLRILLPDSGHLQEEEAEYHNSRGTSKHAPALPLYTARDGLAAADHVTPHPFGTPFKLMPDVSISYARAGHILGAATVTIEIDTPGGRRRLVFSGDLGRYGAPILHDPAPIGEADYIVVESTYGDRRHDPEPIGDQLQRIIMRAVAREGAIVVPAFAVGRTQELMYHLALLEHAGRIPRLPTYIDSPMAISATDIYRAHPDEFDAELHALCEQGRSPFEGQEFRIARSVTESKSINAVAGPVLIISASGMATGGRVLHHLRTRLPDPRATVLLVGYQAIGTRGRALQEGARTVRIYGEHVPVRAEVMTIDGLSAHADADGILRWLRTARHAPRRLFVVHGDPAPAAALAERVRHELSWPVTVPTYGDRVALA